MAKRRTHEKRIRKKAIPTPVATVKGFRELARALTPHGAKRSHVTLSKLAKDPRWYEMGFSRTGPWPTSTLPAMARWICEHLQEDRSRPSPVDDDDEEEEAAEDGVDLYDVDKLVRERNLGRAKTIMQLAIGVEKKANLRVDRLIKEREYVAREEAEEAGAVKWRSIKQALMQIPKALRQILADTIVPGQVEDILTNALRAVCDEGFEGGVGK